MMGKKKKKKRRMRATYRQYMPSLRAFVFDIKGSRPKGKLSGLEFRPL